MYFTSGQDRAFERLMQEKPGFDHYDGGGANAPEDCGSCHFYRPDWKYQYCVYAECPYQPGNLPRKEKLNTDGQSTDSIPFPSLTPAPARNEAAAAPPERKGTGKDAAVQIYREILLENIEYDYLIQDSSIDREQLDEIVDLMLETVCTSRKSIRIAGDDYPAELVKSKFMNIGQIPNFDKLIATIRSREISASIILQSQSQLKAIYKDAAEIISDNCDSVLFLSGRGKNAKEISDALGKETIDSFNTSENRGSQASHGLNYQKLGKELMSQDEIAVMDGGKCILQLRGVRPFLSEKFDITKHWGCAKRPANAVRQAIHPDGNRCQRGALPHGNPDRDADGHRPGHRRNLNRGMLIVLATIPFPVSPSKCRPHFA